MLDGDNSAAMNFIFMEPANLTGGCVTILASSTTLINGTAMGYFQFLNCTEPNVMQAVTEPSAVFAPASMPLFNAFPPAEAGALVMSVICANVGVRAGLSIFANVAKQFMFARTVAFVVEKLGGALQVSNNDVESDVMLGFLPAEDEAMNGTLIVDNNTFMPAGEDDVWPSTVNRPLRINKPLVVSGRKIPQALLYTLCNNQVRWRNSTFGISDIAAFLNFSHWTGLVPATLGCDRPISNLQLETCTAPAKFQNYVQQRDFRAVNEYSGELCSISDSLPQNPVLVGDTSLTECTMKGKSVPANDRDFEGLSIAFIIVKPLKFTVRKSNMQGLWLNISTPGPLALYRREAVRVEVTVTDNKFDGFFSVNIEGNFAPGSFFNIYKNTFHSYDDYRFRRMADTAPSGSFYAAIVMAPDTLCSGCGLKIDDNDVFLNSAFVFDWNT